MFNFFSPEVPVLLIGAPGTGKTSIVQSQFGYAEMVLTSTLVEEDIGGLPYRDGDYDYRTIPSIFRRLNEAADKGLSTVLFLDELDKARRSVADTLLTLIASRKVGNATLPKDTCIVAAANPPEFGGGDGISEAMQSRFSTIDYVPDVASWVTWAKNEFPGHPTGYVISAIENGEFPIFDMTGEGLSRRITSPRTISMALRFMVRNGVESNEFDSIVNGLLTPSTASQILHLSRKLNNEILDKSVSLVRRSSTNSKTSTILRV